METHLILKKYFEKKKKTATSFSLRLLAKKLEVSPSFLSRIFTGEKAVPYDMLLKLKSLLDIESEVFASLKQAHTSHGLKSETPVKGKASVKTSFEGWELTEESSLRALRQWFYLPILEFITLKSFDGTNEQISQRLGISQAAVEVAVNEMISLGLIEVDNGLLKKANVKLRWGSAKSLKEIRNFHDQMLIKAQENLRQGIEDKDFQRRLITGITLTAPADKIEAAKQKLAECLHEIANELTGEEGNQVYHLSAQLFPLTKE